MQIVLFLFFTEVMILESGNFAVSFKSLDGSWAAFLIS